jgi:cysteinyl-tRNA synthetase
MLKFYNTLNRRKEEFVPLKKGEVGIYSCGPTVYDVAHVGNLSSFVFVDLLRRWLEYRGYKVTHVMNVTDVEDKIIRNCSKTMSNLREYTGRFADLLFEDLRRLNVKTAEVYPRATDHIQEMVNLIKVLIERGHAYYKDGSVYFQISSFPTYGKFAGLDLENIKIGARVDADEYDKDDARDFVLWKGWKPDEDGQVYWDTEIGRGRPGWHIECSAMSMKYLGETIDIHTGGIDLVFPHHQNEIAQSEAATRKQFVRYWLHREFLNVGGGKMSKSAGSGASLSALAPESLDAIAFRYLVVTSHYLSPLNLTEKSMESARNAVSNLRNLYSRLSSVNAPGENQIADAVNLARLKFGEAMDDDLGSPRAMAVFFEFLSGVEKKMQEESLTKVSAQSAQSFIREIDSVLGVNINAQADRVLTQEELELIKEREDARKSKNWKRADEVRNILMKTGVQVEDTAQGTRHLFV